jgi:hypothetical protein
MPGSSLSSSCPLPFFPVCPPLFPPLIIFSGPPLALPTAPLTPSSHLFASLHAAPPHLSPLIFVGVVSPRLPFPSSIWTLMPPLLMTSAHVFFVGVLFSHSWWEFFPHPPFFVVGGLSLISVTHFLPTCSFFFFLGVPFPSTVLQPSVSTGVVAGALGSGASRVGGPSGGGVGFAEVEVIMSWHGGYLIMRASSASWAGEVA